jgi:hypothetical protein
MQNSSNIFNFSFQEKMILEVNYLPPTGHRVTIGLSIDKNKPSCVAAYFS